MATSILEGARNMLEDRKMRKEKEGQVEHFMRMRENMLAKDAFTLADFRESLKVSRKEDSGHTEETKREILLRLIPIAS